MLGVAEALGRWLCACGAYDEGSRATSGQYYVGVDAARWIWVLNAERAQLNHNKPALRGRGDSLYFSVGACGEGVQY